MKIKLTEYNGTNFLRTSAEAEVYLQAAFASNDPRLITRALGNVAKAQNLSQFSRQVGLNRAGLHRSFSETGDPKFSTFFKVIQALGYHLSITSN